MTIALATDTLDSHNPEEQFLRTISSRIAGGGKLTKESEPPRVGNINPIICSRGLIICNRL